MGALQRFLILMMVLLLFLAACDDDTQDEVREAGEEVGEAAQSVAEDVDDAIEAGATEAATVAAEIDDSIEAAATEAATVAAEIDDSIEAAATDVENASEDVDQAIEDLDESTTADEQAATAASQGVQEVGQAAGTAVEELNQAGQTLEPTIVSAANQAAGEVDEAIEEAATEVAQEVVEGVQESAEDVENAAEEVGDAAEEELAENLGTADQPLLLLVNTPDDSASSELAALITEKSGLTVEVVALKDEGNPIEMLCENEAHITALDAVSYVTAHAKDCAELGLINLPADTTTVQVQVLGGTGINNFTALKEKSVCVPARLHPAANAILRVNGIDPSEVTIVNSADDAAVLSDVTSGKCQAGVVINAGRGRVIGTRLAIPGDTISFADQLPDDMQAALEQALQEIATEQPDLLNAVYGWSMLAPAEDATFEPLRTQLTDAGVDLEGLE